VVRTRRGSVLPALLGIGVGTNMENFFTRYKNPMVLMAVLLIQVIALATQVKRTENSRSSGGTRLIRVWTMTAITPFERAFVATGHFFRNTWHNYIDLHDVRKQNRELQDELARLRMEQARLRTEAGESQRLRALLDFKERYVGQTVAAEVIGTSGSDLSRIIQIDKGSRAGVKPDMAVITPDGIVGKVKEVSPLSSQVLMINDRESGAGVILQNSRLRGVLHGVGQGELQIGDVMSDEKVDVGEPVVTSGGDGVYPKGLPVGTVTRVTGDSEGGPFLLVRIKPAANLDRLEQVLVVTRIAEETPAVSSDTTPRRAAEILAERLPSISKPADNSANKTPAGGTASSVPAPGASAPAAQPKPSVPSATPAPESKAKAAATPVAGAGAATAAPVRKPKPPAKPSPSPSADSVTAPTPDNSQNPPPEPKKDQQHPVPDLEKPPR
jgi:rod shape-determining protein MreC